MAWTFYNASGEALTNFGPVALTDLDIDGGTDIGAAIVDADLFIIDDNASGTNRKTEVSRIKTYIGAAVTREGGNTLEGTSTATSAADLISSTVSITALIPIKMVYSVRKSSGHASTCNTGLKLNSTVTGEAATGTVQEGWDSSATNRAEDGAATVNIGARLTSYLSGIYGEYSQYISGSPSSGTVRVSLGGGAASAPTLTITAVVVRGFCTNSGNTLAADEVHVYSWAVS